MVKKIKINKITVPKIPVMKTPEIKFKDKPGKGGIQIIFMRDFGFIPSSIIIQKIHGRNNAIVVSAPKPQSMIRAEELAAEAKIVGLKSPEARKRIKEDNKKRRELN